MSNSTCGWQDCSCQPLNISCSQTKGGIEHGYAEALRMAQYINFGIITLLFLWTTVHLAGRMHQRFGLGARKVALMLNSLALLVRMFWTADCQVPSAMGSYMSGAVRFVFFRLSWVLWTICVLLQCISWGGVAQRVKLVTREKSKRNRIGFAGVGEVFSRSNKRRRARNMVVLGVGIFVLVVAMLGLIAADPLMGLSISESVRHGTVEHYFFQEYESNSLHIATNVIFGIYWIGMLFASVVSLKQLRQVVTNYGDTEFEDKAMVLELVKVIKVFIMTAILLIFILGTYALVRYIMRIDTLLWRVIVIYLTYITEDIFAFSITFASQTAHYGSSGRYQVELLEFGAESEDQLSFSAWRFMKTCTWTTFSCCKKKHAETENMESERVTVMMNPLRQNLK